MFDHLGRHLFSWWAKTRPSTTVRVSFTLFIFVGLLFLSGCARLQATVDSWRGPGFTDNKESEYVAGIRDQDEEPMSYGTMTNKGREIERSLGQ